GSIILIIGTSAPQGIMGILTKMCAKYSISKDNK
ncbi:unnamed protein product, partial [marine sediment metagenome]